MFRNRSHHPMRQFGFIGFGSSWCGSFRPEAERKVRPPRRKEGITSEGFRQPSRSPRSSFQPSRQPERADGRWPIAKKEFTSTPWQSSYRRPALSVTNGCEPLLQHSPTKAKAPDELLKDGVDGAPPMNVSAVSQENRNRDRAALPISSSDPKVNQLSTSRRAAAIVTQKPAPILPFTGVFLAR